MVFQPIETESLRGVRPCGGFFFLFDTTAASEKIQNNTTFLSSVLSLVNNCAILNSTAKKFIYNTYLQNTVESRKSMNIKDEIKALKEQKNAVILAHYYVADEIQEIADYVGDSFALSKTAATLPNPIIVYCGVSFMGEGADAGCKRGLPHGTHGNKGRG